MVNDEGVPINTFTLNDTKLNDSTQNRAEFSIFSPVILTPLLAFSFANLGRAC